VSDEHSLARRLKKGDPAALRELYEETFAPLYRYVFFHAQENHEMTQDVVHDAYLEALRSLPNFSPDKGTLQAWLCGIARNRLRSLRRAREGEKKALHSLAAEGSAQSDLPELEKPDIHTQINVTLGLLPNAYSDVLVRKYVKNMSVRDIAAGVGQTEKAVESLLSRARAAFRQSFAAEGARHE
jgi:RNA polymerase sigma-70 factor (ECF subfamily)